MVIEYLPVGSLMLSILPHILPHSRDHLVSSEGPQPGPGVCVTPAPQQIHLDFHVDDFDAAHEQVITLGGRLLKAADDRTAPSGVQVCADPAGHPFRLCWLPVPT
ncbi:VOC family protein [Nonomuraea aridisoli]|uniref:VOC family protein n=1 Tax=Nonomuraea aridisoli TaxID=2070368 RepID=UPI0015E8E1CF